jgi:hypothetical protein
MICSTLKGLLQQASVVRNFPKRAIVYSFVKIRLCDLNWNTKKVNRKL